MRRHLTAFLFITGIICTGLSGATSQLPSLILYKGMECALFEEPLEKYFLAGNERPRELRMGYIARYEIKDSKLYLMRISKLFVNMNNNAPGNIDSGWSSKWEDIPLSLMFPNAKDAVFAEWYSGRLTFPHGKLIKSAPTLQHCVYEREIQLEVKCGVVKKTVVMDNTKKKDSKESHDPIMTPGGKAPLDSGGTQGAAADERKKE